MAKPDGVPEVPREVIALVVLHAVLSGQSGIANGQQLVGSAKEYVDAAFVFADLMIERAEAT